MIELLLRRIRLNFALILSISLCLIGILYINEVQVFGDFKLKEFSLGELLAILAGALFGVSIYWIRLSGEHSLAPSPARTTALLSLIVTLGNLAILIGMLFHSLVQESEILGEALSFVRLSPPLIWVYPALLGLGSFFTATLLQVCSQKYLSGTQVGMILALQPIVAITLGLLFFGSELQWSQGMGGFMLLLASFIAITAQPKARQD
ncbi:MAG: EamA family transporter [Spirochaetota bacterium]